MTIPVGRSLVPVQKRRLIRSSSDEALRTSTASTSNSFPDYGLVRQETHLHDSEDVETFLPDILGRALARIWLDGNFRNQFAADPIKTLSKYGVYLPCNITIDFVSEGTPRPMLIVYEQLGRNGPRQKLMYLRLMMMAGR